MRRVLVIDDHDRSRTQLIQTLKGSGYEADVARRPFCWPAVC